MAVYNESADILKGLDASQRVILFCLGSLHRPLSEEVELQKLLFLSTVQLPDVFKDTFTFEKYRKGPYSERINEDLSVLSNSGYVGCHDLGLTDAGYGLYDHIEKNVKEPLKSVLISNKEFVSKLTEDELLTFVYTVFPEYTENSVVWNDLKKDRLKNAISMVKKEAITASQAARVAGMSYFEFEEELKKRKIRWKS